MSRIKLKLLQKKAYDLLISGKSIFLTGAGGSGKSAVIKIFVRNFSNKINIAVTSTTGTSALLVDGTTIHSYLGIGLGKATIDSLTKKIFSTKWLLDRWKKLDCLIIDEISMLDPALFDKLEYIARYVRRNQRPFGGIQIVASGDFCQLPCVGTERFCFEAESWNKCIQETIYLKQVIRQNDGVFQNCLNKIRIGDIDDHVKQVIGSRIGAKLTNSFGIKPTKLYSTNISVDEVNNTELDKFANDENEFYEYNMQIFRYPNTKQTQIDKFKKFCNIPETLQLCVGAQVMLTYNMDLEAGLVNGSRGIIEDFIDDYPLVRFLNGTHKVIQTHTWEIDENDKKLLTIEQVPLRVAYAISIHRSQGCSLDYAEIDLSEVFECGQAYVALSRLKTLEGLSIIKIDFDKIVANPKSVAFYNKIS
jgi:ATP-dependent DNA helicase PIF1